MRRCMFVRFFVVYFVFSLLNFFFTSKYLCFPYFWLIGCNVSACNQRLSSIFTNNAHNLPTIYNDWSFLVIKIGNERHIAWSESDTHKFAWSLWYWHRSLRVFVCLLQSIANSITWRFFIDSGLLFLSIVFFSYPPDVMTILDLHGFIQKRTNNTFFFLFSFHREEQFHLKMIL